ncbi:MAG: hypothetical protein KDI36_13560 [Pseudomonadales bacterium]|nr:hypothetical protein [Pseudomonadales bacterium]
MNSSLHYDFVRFGQLLVAYVGNDWSEAAVTSNIESMRGQPEVFFSRPWATLWIDVGLSAGQDILEAIAGNSFWALENGLAARAFVLSSSPKAKSQIDEALSRASQVPTRYFTSVPDAVAWLQEMGIDTHYAQES